MKHEAKNCSNTRKILNNNNVLNVLAFVYTHTNAHTVFDLEGKTFYFHGMHVSVSQLYGYAVLLLSG